ncbi:MAG: phosphoribosylaminoimidazolesuccinocarboxamide synthase [Candidatus ainarchaeum sp.]|nr:phosphoribosylaminoimidazolesuccinocarboxamide synthase [Candidatus ainarchaeum sp.]
MEGTVTRTALPLKLHGRGKVRDTYELGDSLLMVATDRLSAFDVVFGEGIPLKGVVLTQMSAFWFKETGKIVRNHMISAEFSDFASGLEGFRDVLDGRSMLVEKSVPLKVECVVRGYISGSAWKSYKATGEACGIRLPSGLEESGMLPEPIFTPTTKAEEGHDEDIGFREVARLLGKDDAEFVREKSIQVYEFARKQAEKKGIIIADTKMEFGRVGGEVILIDELLTPDSSRFWPKAGYAPGKPQDSFDKQAVRDYVEKTGWDKRPPPPRLPPEIIGSTSRRYVEAYEMVTEKKLAVR